MVLGLPGEVGASGADASVAAHYGDPVHEQRALEKGRAVVELPYRALLLTGADRLGWLDTLTSARVRDLAPGRTAELLVLDVQGRIEHHAWVVDGVAPTHEEVAPPVAASAGSPTAAAPPPALTPAPTSQAPADGAPATWLVTEASRAAALASYLESMRFMLDVQVSIVEDHAVLGHVLPAAGEGSAVIEPAAARLLDPWPGVVPGGTRYSLLGTDDSAHPGRALTFGLTVVPALHLPAIAARNGAAGMLAWEALRVAAWRPRLAREVDSRSLPHELDWLRTAVHLDKGCYRGQEGVARTFNLGRPPRRLVLLHLDGSDHLLPEPGAAVLGEGERVVGQVTTAARHHDLGPVALAVVKRTVPGQATLGVVGPAGSSQPIAAAQEIVVALDGVGEGRPEARGELTPGLRRPGLGR